MLLVNLPLHFGRCPGSPGQEVPLVTTDARGQTHGYRLGPRWQLERVFGPVPGRFVGRGPGDMVVLAEPGEPARYRLIGANGRELRPERFDEVRPFTCGPLEVRLGTQWWGVDSQGRLNPLRGVAFSC